MNFKHLHYFWRVAKAGGVARASSRWCGDGRRDVVRDVADGFGGSVGLPSHSSRARPLPPLSSTGSVFRPKRTPMRSAKWAANQDINTKLMARRGRRCLGQGGAKPKRARV